MNLRVVSLGHKLPAWARAAADDYARRLPRELALDFIELKAEPRDRGSSVAQILEAEARRIESAASGRLLVALDERGAAWSTAQFAQALGRWRDDGADLAFAIGSADGLAASLRARAPTVLSLSALTLPHALARVVLVEQIYRASSLLGGHPYHRE